MYHSNLINSPIAVSPHGSFEVNQLCHSVAICEAVNGDRHNWGNATETEPAFIVYLGCKKEEVASKEEFSTNPEKYISDRLRQKIDEAVGEYLAA